MQRLSPKAILLVSALSAPVALVDLRALTRCLLETNMEAASEDIDDRGAAASLPPGASIFCRLPAPVQSLALSGDFRLLAAWSNDSTAHVLDIETKREILTISKTGRAIAFSPDGKLLGVAGLERNKAAHIWSTHTWEKQLEIALPHGSRPGEEVPLALAYSPCRSILALGCVDATIRLCDVKKGNELRRFENPPFSVSSLAFSANGKLLAVGSHYPGVSLWDVDSGKVLKVFHGHSGASRSVAFSPDQKLVASGSFDKTIRLWQLATGEPWQTLHGHKEPVTSIAFSTDGRFLVSASEDRTIKLWELATGRELHSFVGHERAVRSIVFLEKGLVIASASDDATVRFWRTWCRAEGRQLSGRSLDSLWDDLGDDDGPRAYQTLCHFLGSSDQSLPFLKTALPAASRVDPAEIRKLIHDLDNEKFSVRQKATARLLEFGALVDRHLRNALADPASVESRRRLERLVAKFDGPVTASAQLRIQRSLFILERIEDPEARAVVQQLASGGEDTWLRREATATLARLTGK
jgi:WD40 repeat protein